MAERFEVAQGYRKRAREELAASEAMLDGRFYAAAISRAYYAVYYAITALLIEKDIVVKSHKQTAVGFRKNFIKTGQFEAKYSSILDELFNVRMLTDYDAIPEIDDASCRHLLKQAHDFVERMLA